MKYSKNIYIGFDPFENDRDTGVTCKRIKVVKTRTPHWCASEDRHIIKPRSMARHESVLMDNKFYSVYMCTDCIDEILTEIDNG